MLKLIVDLSCIDWTIAMKQPLQTKNNSRRMRQFTEWPFTCRQSFDKDRYNDCNSYSSKWPNVMEMTIVCNNNRQKQKHKQLWWMNKWEKIAFRFRLIETVCFVTKSIAHSIQTVKQTDRGHAQNRVISTLSGEADIHLHKWNKTKNKSTAISFLAE